MSSCMRLWHASLVVLGLLATGCAGHRVATRNSEETVAVVVRGDVVSAADTRFVLELTNERREVAFAQVDDFLSSPESGNLGRSQRSKIAEKSTLVSRTIAQAADRPGRRVILTRPRTEDPFSDDNVVLYLRSHDAYRVYCSLLEIDEIFVFSVRRMEPDLESVVFTHPLFDPGDLTELRAELAERGIHAKHAVPSDRELARLRVLVAAGVLEEELRRVGAELRADEPLVEDGWPGKARSPKLSAALEDRAVRQRIEGSDAPVVRRAYAYLVAQEVIRPQ